LLLNTVPLVYKTFKQSGGFYHWELGNEPDLYKTSTQGVVRPSRWSGSDYVEEVAESFTENSQPTCGELS